MHVYHSFKDQSARGLIAVLLELLLFNVELVFTIVFLSAF